MIRFGYGTKAVNRSLESTFSMKNRTFEGTILAISLYSDIL